MGERLSELVQSGGFSIAIASIIAILVFLGPVAKSAQFPLHVWLPDAMEGPTPISALIHAATMVAAGVFLIARMFPVFEGLPVVMDVIAWTGAFTAFMGATIAITQNDIKKGLAYSTMSQLGYMVMAMGAGAYGAGLFPSDDPCLFQGHALSVLWFSDSWHGSCGRPRPNSGSRYAADGRFAQVYADHRHYVFDWHFGDMWGSPVCWILV